MEHGYPKGVMAREVPIYYGAAVLVDERGEPVRADIVVYEDAVARDTRDQGRVRFIVENKAPDETAGHNQLVSYTFNTSANGAIWYNGIQTKYFRRESVPESRLVPWPGIPGPGESWDSVGRQRKSGLLKPTDIKGLLKRCHDRLYRRGAAGDDVTVDMVRILIAKTRDEEKPGDVPEFYCTPEEYSTPAGRVAVAGRVKRLFEEFRDANRAVFSPNEEITVGADAIAEVASELQHYRLVSDDEDQWDIMGAVYEEYTAEELKREGGEFFTNRLVVNLLVKMADPTSDDIVLDPAGGTGGFVTAALRYVRRRIAQQATAETRHRLTQQAARRVFYIDIKHRLVKIAKTAMLLTGDGHSGCVQGDSLAPIGNLSDGFRALCPPGGVQRVLTNPPFAGTQNSRISDPHVLTQFELGRRWEWRGGRYLPTTEASRTGAPPEMLFVERAIEWLAPGGLLAIVQPKGVLDTTEPHLATRHLIFRKCRVRAVVSCHKNTFQPYTGTRTALLLLEKREHDIEDISEEDYPIFMAVSRKIGQDSQGVPIFKRNDEGRWTDQLDYDLDEIYSKWVAFKSGTLAPSEYVFSVRSSAINATTLNLNPQFYLPSLNESLRQALQIGDREGWTTTTIGAIATRVYKGLRFKREDLETEARPGGDVRIYFTPAALLQERAESAKRIDLSRAEPSRRRQIEAHVLRRGEVLISRSGTVGRVSYVMQPQAGHIGSDDLIRVEIDDEPLRLYVYGFLKTKLGQDQMRRNEYGTIQQHLEPRHVRDVVVPIPDDRAVVERIADDLRRSVEAREQSAETEEAALCQLGELHVPTTDAAEPAEATR